VISKCWQRLSASVGLLALGALVPLAASAQMIAPIPGPPPVPAGPTSLAINNAYQALVRAGVSNPALAQQANFAYQMALVRYRAGDYRSALASAALASAIAGSASSATPLVAPLPLPQIGNTTVFPPTGTQVESHALPGVAGAVPPPQLLLARNEIELAATEGRGSLDAAKAHYRAALDAWLNGDATHALEQARTAYDLAAAARNKGHAAP